MRDTDIITLNNHFINIRNMITPLYYDSKKLSNFKSKFHKNSSYFELKNVSTLIIGRTVKE